MVDSGLSVRETIAIPPYHYASAWLVTPLYDGRPLNRTTDGLSCG